MSGHNDNIKFVGYAPIADVGTNQHSTNVMVPSRDILIGMSLLAWTYLSIQSFQFAVEGSAATFGPGMTVFDWLYQKSLILGEYGYSVWSVCVTEVDVWGTGEFFRAFLMWQIMIVAMMVPTLLFSPLFSPSNKIFNSVLSFLKHLAGYLSAWALFSMPMVALQWMLQVSGLLSVNMIVGEPIISVTILIATCLFQRRLLKHRKFSTLQVIVSKNLYSYGFKSGLQCVRNTWPLMVSMFAFGLMNLVYMLILTITTVALFKEAPSLGKEKTA